MPLKNQYIIALIVVTILTISCSGSGNEDRLRDISSDSAPEITLQDAGATQTTVVDVTNPATGRTWMDRNLGASRRATSSTDAQAYGDLYQWGRAADGHQKRN